MIYTKSKDSKFFIEFLCKALKLERQDASPTGLIWNSCVPSIVIKGTPQVRLKLRRHHSLQEYLTLGEAPLIEHF